MDIFQKLREKSETDRASAEATWGVIVSRLVSDETVNERDVNAAMKVTSKTLDDLERDVAKAKRIAELQAIVAMLPDATRALKETTAAETAFNLERQREYARNRDAGIVIRTAAMGARANFEAIGTAQRELDSLIDTPVELPLGEVA